MKVNDERDPREPNINLKILALLVVLAVLAACPLIMMATTEPSESSMGPFDLWWLPLVAIVVCIAAFWTGRDDSVDEPTPVEIEHKGTLWRLGLAFLAVSGVVLLIVGLAS